MKKVLVFGTFDGIHQGHLDFFKQAKEFGDYLMVVVGRDETVKSVKGKLPKKTENERLADIRRLTIINNARLGNLNDPYKIIADIKPDVICLGYDQNTFSDRLKIELNNKHVKAEVVRLKPFEPEKYHSSLIQI